MHFGGIHLITLRFLRRAILLWGSLQILLNWLKIEAINGHIFSRQLSASANGKNTFLRPDELHDKFVFGWTIVAYFAVMVVAIELFNRYSATNQFLPHEPGQARRSSLQVILDSAESVKFDPSASNILGT